MVKLAAMLGLSLVDRDRVSQIDLGDSDDPAARYFD
jgi:hypothetical protein